MMNVVTRAAGAVLALVAVLAAGGAAAADEGGHDLHRECVELIRDQGGRVFVDGVARSADQFTLAELLAMPAHCPELGTNELLLPPDGG